MRLLLHWKGSQLNLKNKNKQQDLHYHHEYTNNNNITSSRYERTTVFPLAILPNSRACSLIKRASVRAVGEVMP